MISMLYSNQWEFIWFLPRLTSLQNYSLDHSFFWKLFSSPLLWNSVFLYVLFFFCLNIFFLCFPFWTPLLQLPLWMWCPRLTVSSLLFTSLYALSHWMILSTSMALKMMHITTSPECAAPSLILISHLTSEWRYNCLFCLDIPGASKCNFC